MEYAPWKSISSFVFSRIKSQVVERMALSNCRNPMPMGRGPSASLNYGLELYIIV